jgi:hypothetical protein
VARAINERDLCGQYCSERRWGFWFGDGNILQVICLMARLKQIEIRESDVTYSNQSDWWFHLTGHHVKELLLHFLPHDYVLDGSSKFCAIFGPKPQGEKEWSTLLGVTVCYVENFDVEQYKRQSIATQQETILVELTNAMIRVARASDVNFAAIQKAADAVRNSNFYSEMLIKKLSRKTKDRKFHVEVFRRLGSGIGETWEMRVSDAKGHLLGTEQITESPGHLDRTSHFSRSQWIDNVFQILDTRLQRVQYEFNISKYCEEGR